MVRLRDNSSIRPVPVRVLHTEETCRRGKAAAATTTELESHGMGTTGGLGCRCPARVKRGSNHRKRTPREQGKAASAIRFFLFSSSRRPDPVHLGSGSGAGSGASQHVFLGPVGRIVCRGGRAAMAEWLHPAQHMHVRTSRRESTRIRT